VIALQVDFPFPELMEMPGQPGRGEARKLDDLVDEVGQVEESPVDRQAIPFWRGGVPRDRQQVLKPPHAVEALGREANLRREDLDEPAVAEPHPGRDITDGHGAGSAQRVDGEMDGGADVPGSPIPPGTSVLGTRYTSTTGTSFILSVR
jgi:hypothetical protein